MDNEIKLQSDSVEVKKSTLIMAISLIAVFIVGFYLGGIFTTTDGTVTNTGGDNTGTDSFVVNEALLVSVDDDEVMGNVNAPIRIIEFSDFECPYCGRFYKDTTKLFKQAYVDTGKASFTHRDFPLSFHDYAQVAAEASECAADQGKFWEMHDMLYEKSIEYSAALQREETPDHPFLPETLKEYAEEIGMDSSFDECLDSGKYTGEVQADMQEGSSYGVGGTPATFVVFDGQLSGEKLAMLDQIAASIAEQAGQPLMIVYNGGGVTTVSVSGALPFEFFDSILSV